MGRGGCGRVGGGAGASGRGRLAAGGRAATCWNWEMGTLIIGICGSEVLTLKFAAWPGANEKPVGNLRATVNRLPAWAWVIVTSTPLTSTDGSVRTIGLVQLLMMVT